MAVALKPLGTLLPIPGITLASAAAGIRRKGGADLLLIAMDAGTQTAVVLTQNAFCAAPVSITREHLQAERPRYLLINAGNANAGTGVLGIQHAKETCAAVAQHFAATTEQVLPFSTGVIGQVLPVAKMKAGIEQAVTVLHGDGWADAAQAIMTTDTVAKGVSNTFEIDGRTITITGIAKGSGMICPNMATMLAFVATDAQVLAEDLQIALQMAVTDTFNSITVDGDTSTNDACVLMATGHAGNAPLHRNGEHWPSFVAQLQSVFASLAQAIVRDGEGATKLITIEVEQGATVAECRQLAYTIAHSPLVKTAFFASDPNWGRILAAIGRAGLKDLTLSAVSFYLNEVCVIENGELARAYTEARGAAVMACPEITIRVLLGRGDSQCTIWTTDLSHDYVRINAEYRT